MAKKKATRRIPPKRPCDNCGVGNHPRRRLCTHCGQETKKLSHATVTVVDWKSAEQQAKDPEPTNGRANIDHIKSAAELLRCCDNDLDMAGVALQDAHEILKTWTA